MRISSTLTAGLLLVFPMAAVQASVTQEEAALDLFELAATGHVPVPVLTEHLLRMGPGGTEEFLRDFEERALAARESKEIPLDPLQRLSRGIRQAPKLIDELVHAGIVPGPMRNEAAGVSLHVLQRDSSQNSLDLAVRLFGVLDPEDMPGVTALAPSVAKLSQHLVTQRIGTSADYAELLRASSPHLTASVIDGIAKAQPVDLAIVRLSEMLGQFEAIDGTILNRIHSVARSPMATADSMTRSTIRHYLGHESSFVRQEACFACGHLDDRKAAGQMIRLLADETGTVRKAAHSALCQMTSMTISADPVRWQVWFDRQQDWWNQRGRTALRRLQVAERGELVALLKEVCGKQLFHQEVAESLVDLLNHHDDYYVELALDALGTLKAPYAAPHVARFRDHPNVRLRTRAVAALNAFRSVGVASPIALGGPQSPNR